MPVLGILRGTSHGVTMGLAQGEATLKHRRNEAGPELAAATSEPNLYQYKSLATHEHFLVAQGRNVRK